MATSTPWGPSQGSNQIARGIMFYYTAGHGGVHLSPTRNIQVPEYMRNADGWYEEDCEWSLAAVVFMDEFLANDENMTADKYRSTVEDTFKNWYPDEYEQYYGTHLEEGTSFKRDEALFKERHKNDYVVIAAIGRADGLVDCTATIGGVRGFGEARNFLVPSEEYVTRSNYGFVIDTTKHSDISAF